MNTDQIISACLEYGITNYVINDNGTIDVFGNVNLHRVGITKLPVIFRKVTGEFDCGSNSLTTLMGCPLIIDGEFDCSFNNLTSLKYCPSIVYGDFICYRNNLKSLEYSPYEVGGDYYCNSRDIKSESHSYKGITTRIGGVVKTGHTNKYTVLELFRQGVHPDNIDDHIDVKTMYRLWTIQNIVG